jgi:ADP-ribosylglycohydrolase
VAPAASSSLAHRIRNALLLSTCADRIAAPLDRIRLPSPALIETVLHPAASATAADQTVTGPMLLFAEHLGERAATLDEDQLAWTLAQHLEPGTRAHGAAEVLRQIGDGMPWWQAAPALHHGQGSYGNTAAVRAIAPGLLPLGLGVIAEIARRSAVITHTHPLARDAAAVIASAITLAMRGMPGPAASPDQFLSGIASQAHHPEFTHYLAVVRTLVRHRAGPAEAVATLSGELTSLRSVPGALTAYLRHPADPVAAIRYALALGGRTRATAAMTAALAGARCPQFTPPWAWRESADVLRCHAIAATLAELKDGGSASWRAA